MTLQTDNVDIPLGGGIDQSVPQELVDKGKLLDLRNVRHVRAGEWSKRYGTAEYVKTLRKDPNGGEADSAVASATSMASVNGKLTLCTGDELCEWSEDLGKWQLRARNVLPAAMVSERQLRGVLTSAQEYDVAYGAGYIVVAYVQRKETSTSRDITIDIFSAKTGALLQTTVVESGANMRYVRMTSTGSQVYIVWDGYAANTLRACVLTLSTLTFGGVSSIRVNYAASTSECLYDVANDGTWLVLAYLTTTAGGYLGVATFDSSLVLQGSDSNVHATVTDYSCVGVGMSEDNLFIYVAAIGAPGSANLDTVACFSSITVTAGSLSVPQTVDLRTATSWWTGSTAVKRIAVTGFGTASATAGSIIIAASSPGTSSPFGAGYVVDEAPCFIAFKVSLNIVAASTVVECIHVQVGATLASKIFRQGGKCYVTTAQASPFQSTGTVLDCLSDVTTSSLTTLGYVPQLPVAAVLSPRTTNITKSWAGGCAVVATPINTDTNEWEVVLPAMRKSQEAIVITRALLSFESNKRNVLRTNCSGVLLADGGLNWAFDGTQIFDLCPMLAPENCTYIVNGIGTGNMAAGTYWYTAVWRIVDATGNVWRSAPMIPLQVTTAAATDSVTLWFFTPPSMSPSTYDSVALRTKGNLVLEVYRTVMDAGPGAAFYLAGTITASYDTASNQCIVPVYDNLYGGRALFTDQWADATLLADPFPLYANGGVVEAMCPPALTQVDFHNGKVFGVAPAGASLWYSTPVSPGITPRFSDDLIIEVDPDDAIVGWAGFDDKVVLCGKRRVYIANGGGLDAVRNGAPWAVQSVQAPGCRDGRGVVSTPSGVMYVTVGDSVALMDPQTLQVQLPGEAVRSWVADYPVVTACIYTSELNEVRFAMRETETSATGIELVFHCLRGEWSVNEYYSVADGVDGVAIRSYAEVDQVAGGQEVTRIGVHFLDDDGRVYQIDKTTHLDGGSRWVEKLETTPWVASQSIQGFQRAKRLVLTARGVTRANILFDLGFNYDESWVEPYVYTASRADADGPRPVQMGIKRQKCSAFRVRIRDAAPDTGAVGTGEGQTWTALSATVGVKKGVGKNLDATRRT